MSGLPGSNFGMAGAEDRDEIDYDVPSLMEMMAWIA